MARPSKRSIAAKRQWAERNKAKAVNLQQRQYVEMISKTEPNSPLELMANLEDAISRLEARITASIARIDKLMS